MISSIGITQLAVYTTDIYIYIYPVYIAFVWGLYNPYHLPESLEIHWFWGWDLRFGHWKIFQDLSNFAGGLFGTETLSPSRRPCGSFWCVFGGPKGGSMGNEKTKPREVLAVRPLKRDRLQEDRFRRIIFQGLLGVYGLGIWGSTGAMDRPYQPPEHLAEFMRSLEAPWGVWPRGLFCWCLARFFCCHGSMS